MSYRSADLPNANDIGLSIMWLMYETPQWQIYRATKDDRPVCAWRFWPAWLPEDRVNREIWPKMAAAIAASRRENAAHGLWPIEPAAQGWLIYDSFPRATAPRLADVAQLPQLIAELVGTLEHLHRNGCLHLDVHPDNLYEVGGNVRLAGIGLDLRLGSDAPTLGNHLLARPNFGAAEQFDGSGRSPIGPWTDIFGAAATLYCSLTGKPPADFRDRRSPSWRNAVAAELKQPLDGLGADAAAVERMILAGLEPRIEARPRTVAEWVALGPPPKVVAAANKASSAGTRDAGAETAPGGKTQPKAADEGGSGGSGWIVALGLIILLLAGWQLYPMVSDAIGNEPAASETDLASTIEVPVEEPMPVDGETLPAPDETETGTAYDDELPAMALEDAASAQPTGRISTSPATRPATPAPTPRPSVAYAGNRTPFDEGRRTPAAQPSVTRSAAPPPPGNQSFTTRPTRVPSIVEGPRLRSGSIDSIRDFPVPPGGRQIRDGTSVRVEFTVDTNGVASNCRVTRAGPDPATNERVCTLVVSRLRFSPARNSSGNTVTSRYAWEQRFFATP